MSAFLDGLTRYNLAAADVAVELTDNGVRLLIGVDGKVVRVDLSDASAHELGFALYAALRAK